MKTFLLRYRPLVFVIAFLMTMGVIYCSLIDFDNDTTAIAEVVGTSSQITTNSPTPAPITVEATASANGNVVESSNNSVTINVHGNVYSYMYNCNCICEVCAIIKNGGTPENGTKIPTSHVQPESAPVTDINKEVADGLGIQSDNVTVNTNINIK